MDPQQLNGDAMRKRIRTRVTAIIGSYGEILDLAMTTDNNDLGATASKAYRIEMATQGIVRAAEELLTLIHQMKEIWLFGKLDTTSRSKVQEQTEEDAKAIVALLEQLQKKEPAGNAVAGVVSSEA